eukprot:3119641-Rhodomonas_salina.4
MRLSYACAIVRGARYAMSGTDVAHATTRKIPLDYVLHNPRDKTVNPFYNFLQVASYALAGYGRVHCWHLVAQLVDSETAKKTREKKLKEQVPGSNALRREIKGYSHMTADCGSSAAVFRGSAVSYGGNAAVHRRSANVGVGVHAAGARLRAVRGAGVGARLWSYGAATRCPVLTAGVVLRGLLPG